MRVCRDVLGVLVIAVYLVFFSLTWANALAETPTAKNTRSRVLSAQSDLLPAIPGQPDPNQILALENQARLNAHLPALQLNQTLTNIAQQRADDMANQRYYAHKSPNGTYYYDFLQNTEFKHAYSCENLGLSSSTSANTYISQWMLSDQGHKECLLHAQTAYTGYGVAELPFDAATSDGKSYVVVAIQASD